MRIDLHAHSTVSDGTDTPAELMAAAVRSGLDVIAITDHDTTEGWAEASQARPDGLTLVPGAELSCTAVENGREISVHLLAYLFDPTSPALFAEQRRLRSERRARLRIMAVRMAEDGLPIDPDALFAALPKDVPAGRPHLARALVQAGVVKTVDEAFAGYLKGGHRYYVPRQDTPVETAIDMITEAGGVTVLAHPFAYVRGKTVSADTIAALAAHGLTGIEVDHPDHAPETRKVLRGLGNELGLVQTGSSDYHGTNKTTPLGADTTHPEQYEALIAKASGTSVVTD